MKHIVWKLMNEDEIDESYQSQLKFEYNVDLLNYTIKSENLKPKLGFRGFYVLDLNLVF